MIKFLREWENIKNPSMYHIGLDESSELGECPQCKAFVEANGEIGKSKLFADHVNWIANFHFEQGKRPIMWGIC